MTCKSSTVRSGTSQGGFTLIEVIVALAILALSLGTLYESFGWSLRRGEQLREHEFAWITAQSLLSEIRVRTNLQLGRAAGETESGLRWKSKIDHYSAVVRPRGYYDVYVVTVTVYWGTRFDKSLSMRSLELNRTTT